jgi:hypothetical protein
MRPIMPNLRLALGLSAAALTFLVAPPCAHAQGCVAVRGAGTCLLPGSHATHPEDADLKGGDWLLSLSYRWLHSDRHFVGDREQKHRQEQGTEVINDSHFYDVGVQYAITPRWSTALILPFVHSDRSSLYEHKGNASGERYHTQAGGLGDVRLYGYGWILNPVKAPKGNVQFGLGLKAPTGESDATDIFTRNTGPTLDFVDQSIQPGDGGWGFVTEFNGYYEVLPQTVAFAQVSYLFNPENVNDTPTRIANINSKDRNTRMSIPDQYFFRTGLSYTVLPKWGLSTSLAGRLEGIPVEDLIGDSDGFRRPGLTVSIEPGIQLMKGRYTLSVSAPVALYRNRERSVLDMRRNPPGHGDAAFADYVITTSVAVQF